MAINRTQKDKKLFKVLFVAAEVAPYATVGGFASVISYLSKELVQRGHDVRVLFPKFGLIDEEKYKTKMVHEGLKVPTGDEDTPELVCNVKKFKEVSGGVEIYLLENQEYYEKRANVYDYSDDHIRWALLSRGALEFIRAKIFVPDIIHSHDWHTGIVSNYMKTTYQDDPILSEVTSVFTIHNLKFQGMFDPKHVSELEFDDGKSPVASFFDPRLRDQYYLRMGILYSDVVNTVSKTYAKEIMTEEFGEGLDKLLCEVRYKVFGIVNGLDYSEFDPKTDTLIHRNFDLSSVDELRVENKIALQKEFDLPEREDTMLIGFVGRLDHQKGVDLMISTLYHVLRDFDVQFVHVGGGDGGLADMLYKLREDFPGKVNIYPHPNFVLPRLMFAGCDLMLFPSRFEPCGITQIEAMRYGAVPVVRKIGGLADTVENFDTVKRTGNGFVFKDFNEFALFGQIVRAIEVFSNKLLWRDLQQNAMKSDYGWQYSSKEYERLYGTAIDFKNKKHLSNSP